jgi:DNA-binding IclR family transcriptional regulator
MQNHPGPPAYPIASVDNALRLLLLLRDHEVVGVTQVSEELGIAPSSAHRLLAMLAYRDFAEQDRATRAYRLGPVLTGWAHHLTDPDVKRIHPVLAALSGRAQETANLVVLDGSYGRFLDSVESERPVRVGSRVGVRMPAHWTAAGKALLAELSSEELRARYPDEALATMTSRTIATRSELEDHLAGVRERGFAVNIGESQPEIAAIGAVVRDRDGRSRAAVAISTPASRLDADRIAELAPVVIAAARAADERL